MFYTWLWLRRFKSIAPKLWRGVQSPGIVFAQDLCGMFITPDKAVSLVEEIKNVVLITANFFFFFWLNGLGWAMLLLPTLIDGFYLMRL